MAISSRTPEGAPNRCPVCGNPLRIEPSTPAGDAPCPHCGHLLWFAAEDRLDIQVIEIKPTNLCDANVLSRLFEELDVRPRMRVVLDFCDVEYLSSGDLSALIGFINRVRSNRGRLRMRGLGADLREVFRICRLDQVFEIEA